MQAEETGNSEGKTRSITGASEGKADRRAAERVPCRVLVHHAEVGRLHLYETVEVSAVGCLLRSRSEGRPEPGTRIEVRLPLPGRTGAVSVAGVVVGEAGARSEVFAIAFTDLSHGALCALRAFVVDVRHRRLCEPADRLESAARSA